MFFAPLLIVLSGMIYHLQQHPANPHTVQLPSGQTITRLEKCMDDCSDTGDSADILLKNQCEAKCIN